MVKTKRSSLKNKVLEKDKFDSRHHVGKFDLGFLEPQEPPMVYENELLTAAEKAAYYQDLIQNHGAENFEKIAKDCRKKALTLKKKAALVDKDEALPLLEKIKGFESLAEYYSDPIPPDVLADQKSDDDGTPTFSLTPEQKENLYRMGLTRFKSSLTTHASPKTENEDPVSIQMRELERRAWFWKNIHAWNAVEQTAYYFPGSIKPADWTEAVFVRAQKHRNAVKLLSWEIRHPMMRLLQLAEMGNEDAANEAVAELEKYVRLLNLYAKISPDVFKRVASKLQSWPVVFSPHPKLNQIPQKIAKSIGLGSDLDYVFESSTEWNPNELGCKIVMHLYEHIKKMRQYPESNRLSPFFDMAIKLPDIKQRGSVKAWWVVAEGILKNAYPKPEENEILRKLTDIKDRGKANAKIREIIKNRFETMFHDDYR